MSAQTYIASIGSIQWDDASTIVKQAKLVTDFIHDRQKLPIQDVGQIESEFQRVLGLTRDEWFRLIASAETDRLKLLKAYAEKRARPKQPVQAQQVAAANTAQTNSIYPRTGWLGEFVYEYGKNMESPDSFIFWSGVATLSAVIRRKVSVKFGIRPLFPNFYVILVSKAGQARKGPPVIAAGILAKSIPDINFIDRTSSERLPHDLAFRIQNIGGQTTKVPSDAIGFLCAEELVTVLDDKSYNVDIIKFLIDWWDCPAQRATKTHKHGVIDLKNIHISLLGGTTPDWLQGALSHMVAGGGMLSRTVFVVEDRTAKRLSWPEAVDPTCEQRLMQQLAHIDTLTGDFIVTPDALAWNEKWYQGFRDFLEANENLASALERKQSHIIKLAMILAVSGGMAFEITPDLLEQARVIVDALDKNMPEATKMLEATTDGREILRVLEHIRKAGGDISHSDLLRKNSPYGVNRDKLRMIIDTLEETKEVEMYYDKTGNRNVKRYRIL